MAGGETVAMAKRALAGGGTAWGTTETVFTRADSTAAAAIAFLPGSSKLDGRGFKVKAVMAVTAGITSQFTGAIYFGTSTVVASNTKITTCAATFASAGSGNILVEADCGWDAVSKTIGGFFEGAVNNAAISQAALSNLVSNANPSTEGLGFCVSGTFSISNATNVATLRELTISQI